jgi:diguanylate cyclase (GGDEF)-like protein
MRRPLALMLLGQVIYLANAALLQWGIELNMFRAGVVWTTPLMVLGPAVFYGLARSGWSARLKDPSMVMAQGLYCALLTVLVYAFASQEVRGFILCILPLIIMFGQFNLNGRQFAIFTGCTMAVLSAAVLLLRPYEEAPRGLSADLLELVYVALVLGTSTSIALIGSNIRQKLVASRVELAEALARVHALATTDALTGLANRRHMQDLLGEEVKRHRRLGHPLCVALLDLDHFKRINDLHGHQGGDEALRHFARIARESLREIDVLARWGGEEFLLMMPATTAEQAMSGLLRLRQRLAEHPHPPGLSDLRITCSAGVALHHLNNTVEHTIDEADKALYRAKAEGRDRVCLAPEPGAPQSVGAQVIH